MNRLPRTTFVRGSMLTGATVLLGDVALRLGALRPVRALAQTGGTLVGNVKGLTRDQAFTYTDPASGDPAIVLLLGNGQYVSYDAVCTHAGCTVEFSPQQQLLVCPCHGSVFDPSQDGAVLGGPAPSPLQTLPIRVDTNGDVYVLDEAPSPTPTATPTPTPHRPVWATYDARTNTAHLTIIAAFGHDTLNFNGGAKGRFVFTVPLHARVVVTFKNMSAHLPHGVEIVPNDPRTLKGGKLSPAFSGAVSPQAAHGVPRGTTQTFSFKAGKAGRFLLVCPVRDHAKQGHWDWLVVSKTARTATGVLT